MIKILYSDALEICEAKELELYTFPAKPKDVLEWDISDRDKFHILARAGVWSYETLAQQIPYGNIPALLYKNANLELERTLEP
jgi:hypothetical protein